MIAFALLDASDYVFHRLSHNVRWLWLLHAVHHSDENLDVTTNLRQHPLHLVPTEAWNLIACAAIGVPAWVFLVHEIASLAFAHLHHAAIGWPRWIDRALRLASGHAAHALDASFARWKRGRIRTTA